MTCVYKGDLTEIGEAEFIIQDSWGRGIPITDSMQVAVTSGLAVMSVMSLMKDLFEEVVE